MLASEIKKTIGLLRKLQRLLSRSALITIYRAFARPHLDYGDIIYDKAYNGSFHHKLELNQYNVCLTITGAIRVTSKERLYQELGFESLQLRLWFRKLRFFYKIYKNNQHSYLSNIVPQRSFTFNTRNIDKVPLFKLSHNIFKNSFFPLTVIEWNKLDPNLRNENDFHIF